MESSPFEANPYVSPPSELHSSALSRAERNLLTEVLEIRDSASGSSILSRNMTRSLICSPIAVVFAGMFAAGVHVLDGMPEIFTICAGGVAFVATMAGFFLRDVSEASNTRALRDLLCSITDFAEAERLLYGSPKANAARSEHDAPLAAIPVEDE